MFARFLPFALLIAAPAQAQTELENAGFEAPMVKENFPGWSGSGSPYRLTRDSEKPFEGVASARIELVGTPAGSNPFGAISRRIDARPWRGKRIRFRAAVRVAPGSSAALWLRVDRPGGPGFFDNMQNRPIRDVEWSTYEIVGNVASDADFIFFGLIQQERGPAWIDAVSLTAVGDVASPTAPMSRSYWDVLSGNGPVRAGPVAGDVPARALTARGLANLEVLARAYGYAAHFSATDEAAAADWPSIAIEAVEHAEGAKDAAALAGAINASLRPYAPDFCAYASGRAASCSTAKPEGATDAVAWRHFGRGLTSESVYSSKRETVAEVGAERLLTVDLGGGVMARVALAAWTGADGKTLARAPFPAAPLVRPAGWQPAGFDRSTRLAGVIVGWNLFQHFYPYFDVVKTDWAKTLAPVLTKAAIDPDDKAFERTLALLVAALQDGHGAVAYGMPPQGQLPLTWAMIEGKLVVTSAEAASGLMRGDVIEGIHVPAELFSGSERWRAVRALDLLRSGVPGTETKLRWSRPGASGTAILKFGNPYSEPRPANFTDLRPGILYVNIAANDLEWKAAEAKLAAAKGVIVDGRGYPGGSPAFLQHFASARFHSMPMYVPVITRPDRQGWEWKKSEWDFPPLEPHYSGKLVWLIDARAVSYAESIASTIKGNRFGTLVGSPSAGANGNINPLPLPGGYVLLSTGMKVLAMDGSRHHLAGVIPDILVEPTIDGVRAGRDEVLERGIAVIEGR